MSWDDGAHAKVKKVQITYDEIIYSIQVTYDGSNLQSQLRGSIGPKSAELTLDSDEYITSLNAYSKPLGSQEAITFLAFTTNKRAYGPYGNKSAYQISAPEATGKQIAGFLGSSSNILNYIDVHYAPIPTGETGTTTPPGPGTTTPPGPGAPALEKVEAKGEKGGNQWDDGFVHDAVTKILAAADGIGIQFVQFSYVKNGQTEEAPLRGVKPFMPADPFVINHPEEHLVSVEGWYSPGGVMQGLKFISNKKSSDVFGNEDGTSFTLNVQDKKIIGFHGFAGDYVQSLGAYFAPLTSTPLNPAKKLPAYGSGSGTAWDDGAYDGVKKVFVGQAIDGISVVKFVYNKGAQVVIGDEHGKPTLLDFEEFEIDYPSEYITAVEGTYDNILGSDDGTFITMLRFKTNKKTSIPFGMEAGTPFEFKEKGHKIVGFHGSVGKLLLNKFGVHILPITN